MSPPRAEGGGVHKSKRRNRGSNDLGEILAVGETGKPGLESSCTHISQLFLKGQYDLAVEVTRHLRTPLPERLGVRRRWPW